MKEINFKELKMVAELAKFIEGKHVLLRYFTKDSLQDLTPGSILEKMIENTVEDIVVFQRLRELVGEEVGEPFDDKIIEEIKRNILSKFNAS